MISYHLCGHLSRVECWDWPWKSRTTAVVRHCSRRLAGVAA